MKENRISFNDICMEISLHPHYPTPKSFSSLQLINPSCLVTHVSRVWVSSSPHRYSWRRRTAGGWSGGWSWSVRQACRPCHAGYSSGPSPLPTSTACSSSAKEACSLSALGCFIIGNILGISLTSILRLTKNELPNECCIEM